MSERIKNFKRRSISIPVELIEKIDLYFLNSGYTFFNDYLIELLELGLIKINEYIEIKNQQKEILNKIEELLKIYKGNV